MAGFRHLFGSSRDKRIGWQRIRRRILLRGMAACLISLMSYIAIRLAIAAYLAPTPEAILTLGGRPARERFAAEFAQFHPNLPIWVSSGLRPQDARPIFRAAAVPDSHLYLNYEAVDTVTNFTTLVDDLEKHQIHHIYLITSAYHMPRASAIATIVLGSRGILFTPIAVPSAQPPESQWRVVRDVARSFLWVITGQTGACLIPTLRRSDEESSLNKISIAQSQIQP